MTDLDAIFNRLKAILAHHADVLEVVTDAPGNFYMNTAVPDEKGKPIFFGMVKSNKGKVAFHLMPVYCHPELLDATSDALKARMQGKSCFNFLQVEEELFQELETLTLRGFQAYQSEGKI